MYKIIFIDDEAITLQLLQYAVNWEKYNIEIAGCALDGQEGLELFKKVRPDIVIADIKMPRMTGVDFANAVRTFNDKVKIIFLSAYAEFEYAQNAITYKISEYLLKPLDEEKLESLIQKIIGEIEEERQTLDEVVYYRNKTLENKIRSTFLEVWENGAEPGENAERDMMEEMGVDFAWCYCILEKYPAKCSKVVYPDEKMKEVPGQCIPGKYCAVFVRPGEMMVLSGEGDVTADHLHSLFLKAGYDTRIGVSKIKEHKVYEAMVQAERAAEYTFWTGESISFEDKSNKYVSIAGIETQAWDPVIRKLVEHQEKEPVSVLLRTIIERAEQGNNSPDILYKQLQDIFIWIKLMVVRVYPETDLAAESLRHMDYYRIRACADKKSLLLFLEQVIHELAESIRQHLLEDGSLAPVRKAKRYTEENYYRSDFSLQEAADYVQLSKNHFSYIFHNATGLKFWDYVTNVRIEKARQLLQENNLSIFEISLSVGYETESHFNKKFKQLEGITPGRYRKLHGNK